MRLADPWAIGVDLGGTKIEVARVTNGGKLLERRKRPTQVEAGPDTIIAEIAGAVKDLIADGGSPPLGVGVGLAGQIDPPGRCPFRTQPALAGGAVSGRVEPVFAFACSGDK